jgi:hypothetical protein
MKENQVCTNCVMDTTDSNIRFDEKGVCERCNEYEKSILHGGSMVQATRQN